MSAAGAFRYQVHATRRPSGDSSARPSAGSARMLSMKDRSRMDYLLSVYRLCRDHSPITHRCRRCLTPHPNPRPEGEGGPPAFRPSPCGRGGGPRRGRGRVRGTTPPLELELLDDHRLVPRRDRPFLHRGPRPDRIRIELRLLVERHLVCPEAAHHRRIHRVGDGGIAEQELALLAEALAAIAPQRADAVDVGL